MDACGAGQASNIMGALARLVRAAVGKAAAVKADLFGPIHIVARRQKKAAGESLIYVIQASAGGPVKIGRTTDLKRRLQSIRTTSAHEPRVLRTFAGGKTTEQWVHNRFAAQHIAREWFYFHCEMMVVEPPPEHADENSVMRTPVTAGDLMRRAWRRCFVKSAMAAGVSFGTAKAWSSGRTSPSADAFLSLVASDPFLRAELVRLLGEWDADAVALGAVDTTAGAGVGQVGGLVGPGAAVDALQLASAVDGGRAARGGRVAAGVTQAGRGRV